MQTIDSVFYRVRESQDARGNILLFLERWIPVKKTPAGTWVMLESTFTRKPKEGYSEIDLQQLKNFKELKLIRDNGIRKYCYPVLADAIVNFQMRKKRQQRILSNQLDFVNRCVAHSAKLEEATEDSFKRGLSLEEDSPVMFFTTRD